MSQDPETTVKTAFATLCAEAEDGLEGLSRESRARLRQLEADLGDNPALARTIKDIHTFARWLGKQRKSPEAQKALLDRAIDALPALKASLPDRIHSTAAKMARNRPAICRYTGAPKGGFGPLAQRPKLETPARSQTTRGGAMARHNLHAIVARKTVDLPVTTPPAVLLRGNKTGVGRPRPRRTQPERTQVARPRPQHRRVEPVILIEDWETTANG